LSASEQDNLDTYLAFAHRLADLSAVAVMQYFRKISGVEDKSGGGAYDPVTTADRKAEQVIRAEVAKNWPEHDLQGEEFGGDSSGADYCWLVDPIDGTRPFIMGLPVWGTLIALTRHGKPILGLMNQPFTGERYWSGPGGAFYRGPDGEKKIHTRPCPQLGDAILSSTSPDLFASPSDEERFDALSEKVRMRWFGGDCYAYCQLAAGHIDLVVESGLSVHDIAPLIPIIEGAGGCITSWDGGKASDGGHAVACGDPAIHEAVLKVLSG
jgi:histidinol phosphatase-like enzyme (inositol monophosphatase family)